MKITSRRGRYLLGMVAALVAVFVALYPYLDLVGHCEDGGCPDMVQISASSSPDTPASGVFSSVLSVVCAAALVAGPILPFSERRPDEIQLSPESPPPRL